MISPPPPSPTLSAVRFTPDKPHAENENPALSPKRPFAQHDEDHLSQLESKRRHVHPEAQPPRRAPLDPLSASDLENRRNRDVFDTISNSSHHSLVTSSSLPDLRSKLQPGIPANSKSYGKPRGATPGVSVCSLPPPVSTPPTDGLSHSSYAGKNASPGRSLHSSEGGNVSRATFSEAISSWPPPDSSEMQPTTTTMAKPPRTTGWKSDHVLQPIRSRTSSMPSIRRPPGDLWRSNAEPIETTHGVASAASSPIYSTPPLTPPGLPSYRPELRRRGSDPSLMPLSSVSLSLAPGTQPLLPSEPTKSVPPIGAERSRVVSMTPLKSQSQNPKPTSAYTPDSAPSPYPWCSSLLSPRLQAKWKNFLLISDASSAEMPTEWSTGHIKVSKEDFERLLRHATRNKYATKVISPLSPLRTPSPAFSITTDPAYQLRMPSLSNNPSSRYSKCPPRRTRTLCDGYQSHNFEVPCAHCQECKRDTVGKRLLAFRFRQQATYVQRLGNHTFLAARAMTTSTIASDHLLLSDYGREVFAFEGDEEEKTLWDEVAGATSTTPLTFSRSGSACAVVVNGRSPPATPRLTDLHDFDDGKDVDHPEIPDEDFLLNESVALFRDVSVC